MRNRYGAWNQNRFLRSFYWPKAMGIQDDYKMPAPVEQQLYHEKVKTDAERDLELLAKATKKKDDKKGKKGKGKEKSKEEKLEAAKEKKKNKYGTLADIVANGYPLVTTDNLDYNDAIYDDKKDWRVTPDRNGFMKRLTKGDPYREELSLPIYGSGDFRYFFISQTGDGASASFKDQWKNFLMSVDLDFRMRPVKRFLSFVFETRFFGQPLNPDIEGTFLTSNSVRTRSAYFLIDEIPFNTYVMGGIYRPLFGHYTPDHTALAQVLSGFGQNTALKTLSIGTAPNVPFLYVHKVFPHDTEDLDNNGVHKGADATVINLGGRFVTMGLSGMLSLWRGTYKLNNDTLKNEMTSLTLSGFFIRRLILNFELLRIEREFQPGRKDAGLVYSLESKYRLWRENYAQFNYAASNVARDMKEGESSQMGVGLKSMVYSGLELELMMIMNSNTRVSGVTSTTTDYTTMQFQTHFFF